MKSNTPKGIKNIFFLLMFGIVLISVVNISSVDAASEIQTLGCFQADTEINLIQTCASCTFNNISAVSYPNSSALISNVAMEQDGTRYNFTLNDTQTGTIGEYIVDGFGDLSGTDEIWNYNFFITPTGECLDTEQSIIVFGLMLFLLFLTAAFLFFGARVEKTSVKIFLIALGVLFLLFTLGFSLNVITELMLIGSVFSGMFLGLYRLFLVLISGAMIAIILYLVTMAVTAFSKSRGMLDDDDDD